MSTRENRSAVPDLAIIADRRARMYVDAVAAVGGWTHDGTRVNANRRSCSQWSKVRNDRGKGRVYVGNENRRQRGSRISGALPDFGDFIWRDDGSCGSVRELLEPFGLINERNLTSRDFVEHGGGIDFCRGVAHNASAYEFRQLPQRRRSPGHRCCFLARVEKVPPAGREW
jgi:hypothetical protein